MDHDTRYFRGLPETSSPSKTPPFLVNEFFLVPDSMTISGGGGYHQRHLGLQITKAYYKGTWNRREAVKAAEREAQRLRWENDAKAIISNTSALSIS
jgi:hypothetical protein